MGAGLEIHLLGEPFVARSGVRRSGPRGRKAWGLLAYLLLSDFAPSRQWLSDLLFSEAADPRNALSWSLSQLRRVLGSRTITGRQRVELRLPAGTFVDIRALTAGTWTQALEIPGLGEDLLEGLSFPSSASFEVWLLTERRRLAGAALDVLREAARANLAAGDAQRAVELAGRLVATDPLDEDGQEVLIRAYAAAGERGAAERQRDACIALFRRELGMDPGDAILGAATAEHAPPRSAGHPTRAGIEARLEAGLAAMDAGAVDAGIGSLRETVAEAGMAAAPDLQARALLALGSALVHAVRGRDGEGAGVLHEAIAIADRTGVESTAAQAHRELGYVEMLRGRYDRARRWLRRAASLAGEDRAEAAWAHAVEGAVLADVGRHGEAFRRLDQALSLAHEADARAVEAWTLTFIGRSHLLRAELTEARESLARALDLARAIRWTAFIPLPEGLLADVDLAEGHIEAAATAYEHAHALSLQLGDPCWEGIAGRGMGLVADRRGETTTAVRQLSEARARCVRLPDAWLWVEGYCLDALCAVAIEHHLPEARRWIADLEALATRSGMRELAARAYLHRAALGDRSAAESARVLAAEVDNPALPGSPAPGGLVVPLLADEGRAPLRH